MKRFKFVYYPGWIHSFTNIYGVKEKEIDDIREVYGSLITRDMMYVTGDYTVYWENDDSLEEVALG
jgi:hypothetical protein